MREIAHDVLRHRLVLSYEALADGVTPDDIVDRILGRARSRARAQGAHDPGSPSTGRGRNDEPTPGAETPEQLLLRLEWRVIRRLDGLLQGSYRTLYRGVGTDFLDLREYEPGDDVRHIDWNVTARMDTPFVRQYVEDRELTAWLLLDRSPSMGFGPIDRPKELVLGELATTLARLLTRGGNRVGAILFDNEIERRSRRAAGATRSSPSPGTCCGPPGRAGESPISRAPRGRARRDPATLARGSRSRISSRRQAGSGPCSS